MNEDYNIHLYWIHGTNLTKDAILWIQLEGETEFALNSREALDLLEKLQKERPTIEAEIEKAKKQ